MMKNNTHENNHLVFFFILLIKKRLDNYTYTYITYTHPQPMGLQYLHLSVGWAVPGYTNLRDVKIGKVNLQRISG